MWLQGPVLSDLVGNPEYNFLASRLNNVDLKSVHHFLCEISSSYTKSNGHLTVHSRKIMDSFTIG